jgi:conjugal transfer mating pair stabilization protein TraG
MRYKRKLYKTIMRRLKKQSRYIRRTVSRPIGIAGIIVLVGVSSLILMTMQDSRKIHASELLDTIAKVESKSNYNAYFGNPNNTSIRFTEMTVNEVLTWQAAFVAQGNPSSAVGRYQFIDSTLQGLTQQLRIDGEAKFDEALQDRLAVALLERRGMHEYVDNKISREEFAHSLSKEWAALPRATGENPEQSYYASDGINKAQLSVEEMYASIATVRKL